MRKYDIWSDSWVGLIASVPHPLYTETWFWHVDGYVSLVIGLGKIASNNLFNVILYHVHTKLNMLIQIKIKRCFFSCIAPWMNLQCIVYSLEFSSPKTFDALFHWSTSHVSFTVSGGFRGGGCVGRGGCVGARPYSFAQNITQANIR